MKAEVIPSMYNNGLNKVVIYLWSILLFSDLLPHNDKISAPNHVAEILLKKPIQPTRGVFMYMLAHPAPFAKSCIVITTFHKL